MVAFLGYLIVFIVLTAIVVAVYLLVSFMRKKLIHRKRARILISMPLAVLLSAIGIIYIMSQALGDKKTSIREEWPIDSTAQYYFANNARNDTLIGMTKREVIKLLGVPSDTLELLRGPADTLDEHYTYFTGIHEGV